MPHLSKRWWHPQDTEDPAEAPAYKPIMESIDTGEKSRALGLLQDEQAEPDLWRKALETLQCEEKWDFLSALHLDDKNTLECVDAVRKQASQRAEDTRNNERGFRLPGGKTYTYRQVYENIATYANKFQIVGDLLVQADPGYATVPWALVRFGITAAIGESETYHRMLDGTQFAAKLIAQYPVIEKTYAQVDSELSAALRNSLEKFYVVLLRYQIRAIIYFDAGRKVSRTLTGLNPVSADENKKLREAVTDAMTRVDHDIALVHADISQKGISELLAGQSKQLATTMDGILALANSTGSAMRSQHSLLIERFDEADASQNKRMKATVAQIVEQWQGPLGDLMTQLEKEEIAREEEQLAAIRTWLSAAQPEQDHDEARSKRPMHLGDWLLRHAKFVQWRNADRSSILWLYGLPGTGKTNLSWRVINELKNQGSEMGRKQNSTRQDGYSTTFREFHSAAQALVESNSNITVVDHDRELDLNALAPQTQGMEHATEVTGAPTTGALAFFYCSNDKAERGRQEVFSRADPEELLRSIVSQLARSRQDRSIAPALMAKYTGFGPHSDKQRILNYSDCADVILAIAADVRITIVIDALDECDHGTCLQLIDKLKEIIHRISQNASLNPMKIFIATRSFTAIEHELTPDHALEVTAENNCEDVKKFIDVTLEERSKDLLSGTASAQLKSEIRDTLSRRAQNMFLYASLLLKQLCDRHHYDDEESVRRKLDELPKNLTDVYDRVLADIHDDKNNSPRLSHIAQDTFKWLLQAQESLDCESILEAVSSIGGKAKADEILRSCRTLVVKEKAKFNFAHYSIREYLDTKAEYSPGLCHLVATQSCLRILNTLFELEESGRQPSDAEKTLGTYASMYWPVHHERIRFDDADDRWDSLNIMLRKFLLQGHGKTNRYTDWLSRARALVRETGDHKLLLSKLDSLQATPPSALFAACVFGFPDIIGKFGRDSHGLNRCNVAGQSALCLAIENNKLETVKALLSRRFPADVNLLNIKAVEQLENLDADYNLSVIQYASPLQAAAACGFCGIAEYLLEKGAHVDLVAGYYGNALQAASLKGHESMVILLLSRGAEPNSQGGYHGNALQAAAAQGHIGVINLLLENRRPALVSTPGGPFGSALMAAVCSGNSETVWVLLDEGADPNVKVKKKYGYPLAQAAALGFKDIVSLLLVAHANANLAPRETPLHILHHAAMHGMNDLVEYCLEEKCDVDMETLDAPKYFAGPVPENPRTMTPLALACAEGQTDMVKLLIRRGATLEIGDRSSSAFWVAVGRGQADVVHLLIEAYKEKHAPELLSKFVSQCPPKTGHPMLFIAVAGGCKAVVRELLDNRARFENNWFGASPLIAAATFNEPQIAEMLLAYAHWGKLNGNLLINTQARNKRTALFEACTYGHHEVATILLEHGAAWSIPNDISMTVLHKVVHEGDAIVFAARLLEKAYNGSTALQFDDFLNNKNKFGRTALMAAAKRNRSLCFDLLLKHGADWSLASDVGVTALHISCWEGHETVLALLLKAAQNADRSRLENFLNHRNDQGKTALVDAVERDRPSFVKHLLELGADYAIAKFNGETALHVGSFRGFESAIERVLERASLDTDQARFKSFLNARNDKGKTALTDAVETDQSSTVQLLLKYAADYTIQDNSGFTALHYGASRDNRASVERLLETASRDKSEDAQRFRRFLNQRSHTDLASAIHNAAMEGHAELVDLLVNTYGADYTCVGINKCTPLHLAVQSNSMPVFEVVLGCAKKDPDVQRFHDFLLMRDKDGRMAWMNACEMDRGPMKEKLKAAWGNIQ